MVQSEGILCQALPKVCQRPDGQPQTRLHLTPTSFHLTHRVTDHVDHGGQGGSFLASSAKWVPVRCPEESVKPPTVRTCLCVSVAVAMHPDGSNQCHHLHSGLPSCREHAQDWLAPTPALPCPTTDRTACPGLWRSWRSSRVEDELFQSHTCGPRTTQGAWLCHTTSTASQLLFP